MVWRPEGISGTQSRAGVRASSTYSPQGWRGLEDLSALPRHATLITMLLCGSIYSHTPSPLKAPISLLFLCLLLVPADGRCEPAPGIAMHGEPAEPPGFTHFPYANPDAPKGGRLVLAKRGSFDSLNPLIVKGVSAEGIREYVYESLLARAYDEPFSLYGLIAESVDTPDDRSFVEFTLNPEAKFSDGKPITVDDVIFSFELLRDHGRPNHRSYYQKVSKVEKTGDRKVKFTFDGSGDREMPLIMGLMPVLPRHLIDPETFEKTSFVPPIGSGPYLVGEVKPGQSISLKRDPNYWGAKLPGHQRPVQFRRDPLRLLSRHRQPVRGLQGRRHRRTARGRSDALDGRLQHPRRCVTGGSSRRSFRSRFQPACRRSCSTRAARSSPINACARL